MNLRFFISIVVLLTGLFFVPAGSVLAAGPAEGVPIMGNDLLDESIEEATQAPVFAGGRAYLAKFVSDTAQLTNTNPAVWANAFATSVAVPTGGGGCVSLRFSSEATAWGPLPVNFQIRAIIGNAVVNTAYVFFDPAHVTTTSGQYSLAAFNWWRCGLTAATYPVYVQFKPFSSGRAAAVRGRTLLIEY